MALTSHRHRFLSAAATTPSIPPPSWLRRARVEMRREALARGFSADGVLRRNRPLPARRRPLRPRQPRKGGDKSTNKIAKAIRARISSFSSSRTRLSCWGNTVTRHPIRRSWSGSGTGGGEHGSRTVTVTAVMAPSRKTIAAGARSLIERNDFYCQDCNTHK